MSGGTSWPSGGPRAQLCNGPLLISRHQLTDYNTGPFYQSDNTVELASVDSVTFETNLQLINSQKSQTCNESGAFGAFESWGPEADVCFASLVI